MARPSGKSGEQTVNPVVMVLPMSWFYGQVRWKNDGGTIDPLVGGVNETLDKIMVLTTDTLTGRAQWAFFQGKATVWVPRLARRLVHQPGSGSEPLPSTALAC